MVVIISKNSIEAKIRKERDMRADVRRQEDTASGLRRTTEPQRGDYALCRRVESTLKDMKRYSKNPEDVKKIEKEYYGIQAEEREKARRQ